MINLFVWRRALVTILLVLGWTFVPGWPAGAGEVQVPAAPAGLLDLSRPECDPPDCPAWAKQKLPDWVMPYVGINGLPKKWRPPGGAAFISPGVKGLDRYQANQFIFYCPQTADYLYREFTPLKVDYRPGTLPGYEKMSARYTVGCKTDTERAVALLKGMVDFCPHPVVPPCGKWVDGDRNLDDEALLASGCAWCNEQARVFIRLCQVNGIPARMLHLWNQSHTAAEFYADGRWAFADASLWFVVKGKDGKLLSAAQCHDRAEGQRLYAETKQRRLKELFSVPEVQLKATCRQAREWLANSRKFDVNELAVRDVGFGVINYPLPR